MKYSKKINGLVYIKKCCHTCEFNFCGVCAGSYYGEKITDDSKLCGSYGISLDDYCKLTDEQQDIYHQYLY